MKTPIQTGENLLNPLEFQKALKANAADYYMFDVQRIAGVTGWLAAVHSQRLQAFQFPLTCSLKSVFTSWPRPKMRTGLSMSTGPAQ
ncbi:MAG: hypothetical protein Ct9H300mP14_00610 [Gammaproteobacteria bacterium]|nr:MAG: hypothetical protein Ct9H300mP14_00610 [Gammaproteobacteria bacterium]